ADDAPVDWLACSTLHTSVSPLQTPGPPPLPAALLVLQTAAPDFGRPDRLGSGSTHTATGAAHLHSASAPAIAAAVHPRSTPAADADNARQFFSPAPLRSGCAHIQSSPSIRFPELRLSSAGSSSIPPTADSELQRLQSQPPHPV